MKTRRETARAQQLLPPQERKENDSCRALVRADLKAAVPAWLYRMPDERFCANRAESKHPPRRPVRLLGCGGPPEVVSHFPLPFASSEQVLIPNPMGAKAGRST